MSAAKCIVWFRNDLRLADNPALTAALKHGDATALYIHETDPELRPIGAAARWWLHHSLNALASELAEIGVRLEVRTGPAETTLKATTSDHSASAVFWNRRYSKPERDLDAAIKQSLHDAGIKPESFAANVLCEPWDVQTLQGKPYSVFTPFARVVRQKDIPAPLHRPTGKAAIAPHSMDNDYTEPHWAKKLAPHWSIGEQHATTALHDFLDEKLSDYPEGRDIPARDATSRLSPYLRFGEISPRQIWNAATAWAHRHPAQQSQIDKFLAEVTWRDFNYHQLFHRDDIATIPMQPRYADINWRHQPTELKHWQSGQTGFPIVDAGMRELWATGYMQNRVRMLTASLLAKNLLIDWRLGEQWFWDCLVDADIASNPGNWQWVAGSGLDASPYFRIFNPVTQGDRFDANGAYVRQWVPELANLPDKWIQQPFAAPPDVLASAGVTLGTTYPAPIVDLKISRQRALDASGALPR